MNEWQSIETCPDNVTVLFWGDDGIRRGRMEHDCLRVDGSRQDHFWGDGGFNDSQPPTHWMPLPDPPISLKSK